MKLRMAVGVCVVMMLAAVVWVRAAETGEKKPMSGRLTQPWSKISSLSDDQKTQIRQIHAKAVSDKKAIDDKERADIMALLNDEQKTEAQKLLDEQKKTKAPPAGTEVKGDPSNEKKVEEKKATD
jgi:Spy/CpxP family protein refolding chaperone